MSKEATARSAMKLALEALAVKFSEGWHEGIKIDASDIMLLNDAAQALAEQPAQKRPQNCGTGYCSCIECVMEPAPVAWLVEFENGEQELHFEEQPVGEINTPLYTTPPQRTWVGLTDEEIIKCWGQVSGTRYGYVAFARAIEAAHGIKENT